MKVIIVAHNQLKLVQMEIEALRLLAGIEERDLIIVDNASQDGLRQWLEERPGRNPDILQRLFKRGRKHFGVHPQSDACLGCAGADQRQFYL